MEIMLLSVRKLFRMSVASLLGVSNVSHNSKLTLQLRLRLTLESVSSSTEVAVKAWVREFSSIQREFWVRLRVGKVSVTC